MDEPGIPELLRDHARTFALTLQLLPVSLREPLGIAYLLARASDTVADAGYVSREQRRESLWELEEALQAGNPDAWKPSIPVETLSLAEQELIKAVPRLSKKMSRLPDQAELLHLWRTIVAGHLFDLRSFSEVTSPLSRTELEHYCYLVAGCVGESWTRLIAGHAPEVLKTDVSEMISLGCSYGKGLQLVNILRDRTADHKIGRIYVEEKGITGLVDLAETWLEEGLKYLSLLRPGRILYATALPHDLALRTLCCIRNHPEAERVKVSRATVYALLAKGVVSLWLPRRANPA
jgi:farnesyl-diphosphate farnesyltransferase